MPTRDVATTHERVHQLGLDTPVALWHLSFADIMKVTHRDAVCAVRLSVDREPVHAICPARVDSLVGDVVRMPSLSKLSELRDELRGSRQPSRGLVGRRHW